MTWAGGVPVTGTRYRAPVRRIVLAGPDGVRFDAEVPETRRERARGLLGRPRLPPGHAMLIPNARSVHTVGMRFPIDAAFLDANLVVLSVKRLAARRVALPRLRARHVLECAAGTGPRPGDRLRAIAGAI